MRAAGRGHVLPVLAVHAGAVGGCPRGGGSRCSGTNAGGIPRTRLSQPCRIAPGFVGSCDRSEDLPGQADPAPASGSPADRAGCSAWPPLGRVRPAGCFQNKRARRNSASGRASARVGVPTERFFQFGDRRIGVRRPQSGGSRRPQLQGVFAMDATLRSAVAIKVYSVPWT